MLTFTAPQVQTLGSTDAETPSPDQVLSTAGPSTLASDSTTRNNNDNNSDGPSTLTTDGASTSQTDSTGTDSNNSNGPTSTSGKKGGSKTDSTPSQTVFDPRLPPGGLSMITPNAMSSTQYYKIGNYVTFGWNFTSLSVTPSALDILASCATNQATYTLALNQSVSGSTGAVTWDTGDYQATASTKLLTGQYTLMIYDAESSISATPAAGYLAPYRQFTFGMYLPQPYVALEGIECITCSSATRNQLNQQTLGFVVLMAVVSTVTFTCFAGGAGVLF